MQYNTVQYSCNTRQYSCNAIQYSCSTRQYSCNAVQHSCNIIQYITAVLQYNTGAIQYSTLQLYCNAIQLQYKTRQNSSVVLQRKRRTVTEQGPDHVRQPTTTVNCSDRPAEHVRLLDRSVFMGVTMHIGSQLSL